MTARGGATRAVLLGAGMGLALVMVALAEARVALGGLTAFVGLVPVALAFALGGPVATALAIGVWLVGTILCSAFQLLSMAAGVIVALRHVGPGLALGIVLVRRLSLSASLLIVSGAGLLGLAVLVAAFLPTGPGLVALVQREIDAHVGDVERLPAFLRLSSDPGVVTESVQLVARLMRVAAPAVVIVGLIFVALGNYLVARLCMWGGGFRAFAQEAVPDHLVWGVIAGGFMLVSQQDTLDAIGLNLLIVLAPLYAIQGLAVLRHLFQRARLPRPIQGMSFGLFAVQPLLLIAVACLGLSDLWVDFRKIRRAPTPA